MKLFLISQLQNNDWDTYDSAVVAASDANTAKHMNPAKGRPIENWEQVGSGYWCNDPQYVKVRYLGEAAEDIEEGVICASFNAG